MTTEDLAIRPTIPSSPKCDSSAEQRDIVASMQHLAAKQASCVDKALRAESRRR
jgi:hypothetical protein